MSVSPRLSLLLPPVVAGRLRALIVPSAWLSALAAGAWVASGLVWRLTAPAVELLPFAPETDPRAIAQRIAAQRPFAGQASASANESASPAMPPPVFRLHGLATGFAGGPGFALVSAGDGSVRPVLAGEEIAAGVRVARILAEGVELDQGGKAVMLRLPSTGVEAGRAIIPTDPAGARHPSPPTSSPSDRSQ